jgi:protein-L-isoaspartate(D-aspartate) O-methyltransferase
MAMTGSKKRIRQHGCGFSSAWLVQLGVLILTGLGGLDSSRTAMAQEPAEAEYRAARERLVREHIANPPFGARFAVRDSAVLAAMQTVPRHRFVPEDLIGVAYEDRPLPIGHGQTISQPFIVASMTEILAVGPEDRVLEIGTGSGYQAAVLAEIVAAVLTIEIVEPLAESARIRLKRLGYENVTVRTGDGYFGWENEAPFDGIIVTAAASHIPPPLLDQLRPGARMVIPVGPPFQVQTLMLVEKGLDGKIIQRGLMPVRFVPFTRSE